MKKLLDFIIRIKYYLDFIDGKISYIPKQNKLNEKNN